MQSYENIAQDNPTKENERLKSENFQLKERLLALHKSYSDMKWANGQGTNLRDSVNIIAHAFAADRKFILEKK